jgi:hypothetical protein
LGGIGGGLSFTPVAQTKKLNLCAESGDFAEESEKRGE